MLIGSSKLPQIEEAITLPRTERKRLDLGERNLLLGALGISPTSALRHSIGSFLINYFGLPQIAALPAKAAAGYVSSYWGSAMVEALSARHSCSDSSLETCLPFAQLPPVALVTTSMLLNGHAAMWTILAVGLFNSIMFPTIFSVGEAELGS